MGASRVQSDLEVDGGRRTLSAEELARDVEGLAADDNDLLAVEELLGNDAGEAAQKVALAVDDNLGLMLARALTLCCWSGFDGA